MPQLKDLLDRYYERYHVSDFIPDDPLSIPHRFSKREDIEIMGFFAAVLAWGQRKTIINKCLELEERFSGSPFQFITNASDRELKALLGFKHRTFNDTDLLYFVEALKSIYHKHGSLERAFKISKKEETVEVAINNFRAEFFSLDDVPIRTLKHISSPAKNSACKRLAMFLRWMVRSNKNGVDFGIWKSISPAQLVCPCDVHVERVARRLGLIERPSMDWKTALELTSNLRNLDPKDPVKYDFALFGMGLEEKGYLFSK
jgi:uncharacterized protein (TIGR02757 family)